MKRCVCRSGAARRAESNGTGDMPCRKENYLLLEQSVSVDSVDVDALVSRIGEALQLHSNPDGAATAPARNTLSCCKRLRNHRRSNRSSPYQLPSSHSEQDWDQIRPWNRKRVRGDTDEPHRLLQELLLSGNLIKEAVRRLQLSAADCGDFPRAADSVPCS